MTSIFQLIFSFWASLLSLLETPVIVIQSDVFGSVSASYLHIVIALFVIAWMVSLFFRSPKA